MWGPLALHIPREISSQPKPSGLTPTARTISDGRRRADKNEDERRLVPPYAALPLLLARAPHCPRPKP